MNFRLGVYNLIIISVYYLIYYSQHRIIHYIFISVKLGVWSVEFRSGRQVLFGKYVCSRLYYFGYSFPLIIRATNSSYH